MTSVEKSQIPFSQVHNMTSKINGQSTEFRLPPHISFQMITRKNYQLYICLTQMLILEWYRYDTNHVPRWLSTYDSCRNWISAI